MEFYLVVGLLLMNWGLLIWLARRCDASVMSETRIRAVARGEVFAVMAAVESVDGPREIQRPSTRPVAPQRSN